MRIWPSYLPAPTIDYAFDALSNVVRTRMDSGRTRQRRRSTALVRNVKLRFELSDQQMADFTGFFQDLLSGGADEFQTELFFGDGKKTYTVRFTGNYTAVYRPHLTWLVSCAAEVFAQQPLSRDVNLLTYIIDGDPDAFEEQSDALHTLVNVTLPERN